MSRLLATIVLLFTGIQSLEAGIIHDGKYAGASVCSLKTLQALDFFPEEKSGKVSERKSDGIAASPSHTVASSTFSLASISLDRVHDDVPSEPVFADGILFPTDPDLDGLLKPPQV